MRNKLIIGALIVGLAIAGGLYYKYRTAPTIRFDKLELYTLNGNAASLKQWQGKKVFINFFATWCGPCLHEMPLLWQAEAELKAKNFVFIYISDEPPGRLQAFKQYANRDVIVLRSKKKLSDLGIHSIPTSYLLNEEHKTVYDKTGALSMPLQQLTQLLQNY